MSVFAARRLALVLCGILVGLALAEAGLRLLRPIPPERLLPVDYKVDRVRRLAAGDTYARFDRALGWTTMPATTRRDTRYTYRNNRAGLRAEREYGSRPPSGVRRLAAFGESFTYCQEADLDDCWTSLLEQALPDTEVLNFGVPAYGPDQAWLRYQAEGPAFSPCAVLIGYMTENVNRVVNRFRPFYQPDTGIALSKPRFLLRDGGLELLPNPVADPDLLRDPRWVEEALGPSDRWYFPGTFVANPLDVLYTVRLARTVAFDLHHGSDPESAGAARSYRARDEAFQVAGRVLVEFARDVGRRGSTPVVVVFSPAAGVDAATRGQEKVYRPLLDWLDREGIAWVDVTDALAEEARRSGVEAVVKFHYTPRGNAIVAETLARALPPLIEPTCRG